MISALFRSQIVAACVFVMLSICTPDTAAAQSNLPPCPANDDIGSWNYCFGSWTFRDGDNYSGKFTAGDRYVGEWRNGSAHGQGTWTYANGTVYVGQFKEDKFDGQGALTFESGMSYRGEFKEDKFDGQGTLTSESGMSFRGEFREGKPIGISDILTDGFKGCINSEISQNLSEEETRYICTCAYFSASKDNKKLSMGRSDGSLTLLQVFEYLFTGEGDKLYDMEKFIAQQTLGQCALQLMVCGSAPGVQSGVIPCPSRR